ncbi:hypothetical protein [Aurantiacibacter sp. MUD61]|uniref:hypothetical protein n=1 Tax=Aurantiacibacter sp. MUD61 TaxID=3009083 RepID=UPI0022F1267F|nr:hypothetical protein [Aurantiacibacter sp. MUD61]
MSMNELLYDHQLAILRAQHAALGEGDLDLRDRSHLFAQRIADWRSGQSLPTVGWPGHAEDGQRPETHAGTETLTAQTPPAAKVTP